MDPQRITAKYGFPLHLATEFVEKCRQNIRSPYPIPSSDAPCCYTIADRPFLQLIDTLASIYPIDFYGKLVMIIQQLVLIMTHVFTIYIFTV